MIILKIILLFILFFLGITILFFIRALIDWLRGDPLLLVGLICCVQQWLQPIIPIFQVCITLWLLYYFLGIYGLLAILLVIGLIRLLFK
jgi:hypothetical protein